MFDYHVEYQVGDRHLVWSRMCTDPVSALHYFHHYAQEEVVTSANDKKRVIKPKLRYDQYTIERLYLKFNLNPMGKGHEYGEEIVELPKSANPDLRKPTRVKEPVLEFDGMPAKGEGRLAP